jgi:hypothetical protein
MRLAQGRVEETLLADSGGSSVFGKLFVMDRENRLLTDPERLFHPLLGEFAKNIAMLSHDTTGRLHLLEKALVVRSQFNAIRGFCNIEPVALFDVKLCQYFLRENDTGRVPD